MLLQIILFLLIGIFAGTLTGLIPGIHINLLGVILISLSASLLSTTNPIYLGVFITSMAITHTFVDFIPSIFLGCPDTDTELSILPGHELLKRGFGYEAVLLTAYGSLTAIFMILIISYPSIIFISKIYSLIKTLIPYLLILISIILILLEKNKLQALGVFLLTGFLGYLVLNMNNLNQPLLPLLTGLFGSSMLIKSIKNKTKIPPQKISKYKINIKNQLKKPIIGALIAAPLCSFLPGMGSGQAAVIGNIISKTPKKDLKSFLILLGATNTLVMSFSFISLYTISRTRTGAAVAIQELTKDLFNYKLLILILIIIFISGIISFFLTKFLAKKISKYISRFNYTILSYFVLGILIIVVLIVSKTSGLLILILSTLTGIYCISIKIRRTNMMGCLLIPTIVFYLTI